MNRFLIGAAALAVAVPAMAQMQPALAQPQASPTQVAPPLASKTQRMEAPQTRDEAVAKVRAHFARMDTNRDGFVAADELRSMRDHHAGMACGKHGARAASEWLQAKRDNLNNSQPGGAGRAVRGERMGGRSIAPVAMAGDRPGMRMHRMGGGHGIGGGMMRMADLDRDGRVSLEEATTAALQRFDRFDANRDGRITPDEKRQQREMRRQMRGQRAG